MIIIENTEVQGFEPAIRGMRNAMNSWGKSDSLFYNGEKDGHSEYRTILGEIASGWHDEKAKVIIGPNDQKLMKQLRDAGKDHAKYRRMITVWVDVTAPFYWWKEFDTYKVGTVANSCSTMHKIAEKEFSLRDFSHDHLIDSMYTAFDSEEDAQKAGAYEITKEWNEYAEVGYEGKFAMDILRDTIDALNAYRKMYLETKDKKYWWQMIQLLPSSYMQKRTLMLNYEVLANIYHARKDHKLDEWHVFCDWIRLLPESWIITGEDA